MYSKTATLGNCKAKRPTPTAFVNAGSVVAATTEVDGPGLEPNSVNFSMRRVAEGGSSKMRF
jgi:hypothetical protein